jgi:membrane-associated phospholipid phosphatase
VSADIAPPPVQAPSRRAIIVAWGRRHRLLTELGVLAAVWAVYSFARSAASDDLLRAQDTAIDILRIERNLGIDLEAKWNAALVGIPWLADATAAWYSSLHYVVTLTVLVILYRRYSSQYRQLRRALLSATMVALVFYVLLPTAPPRLMPEGYVDVVQETFSVDSSISTSAPRTGLAALTNQLAAFPSMHAGWALWSAIAIWAMTRSLWLRVASAAYAVITAFVVVITANHWIIDVAAGWLIIAGAYALQRPWRQAGDEVAPHPRRARRPT